MGADVNRVHALQGVVDQEDATMRPLNFQHDLAHLAEAIAQVKAVLVIVDPINSYFGDKDSYKDTEIRSVLLPLVNLAETSGVGILALTHCSKDAQRRALFRALGGIGFAGVARIVMAAGSDPDNPKRRYLMPVKQNICAPAATLAYSIQPTGDDDGDSTRFEWDREPVTDVNADQILAGRTVSGDEQSDRQNAIAFLQQLLADGPVPADEVEKQSKRAGFCMATLQRSKRSAGAASEKVGFRPGKWMWFLKHEGAQKITAPCDVSTFGQSAPPSTDPSTSSSKMISSSQVSTFGEHLRDLSDAGEL